MTTEISDVDLKKLDYSLERRHQDGTLYNEIYGGAEVRALRARLRRVEAELVQKRSAVRGHSTDPRSELKSVEQWQEWAETLQSDMEGQAERIAELEAAVLRDSKEGTSLAISDAEEARLEAAYWAFDTERKRSGMERDAFKGRLRLAIRETRAAAADVVKHLSNEDGLGLGSSRIEKAITGERED